jgi:hypothetical protein
VLLITCWHHLRQALDHHWLLVLWAVEQQQAVVAATWRAAFLPVCAATITACSDDANRASSPAIGGEGCVRSMMAATVQIVPPLQAPHPLLLLLLLLLTRL